MPKFILTVRKHPKLSYIISAYLAQDADSKTFIQITEPVTLSVVEKRAGEFTEKQQEIVKIIETYSEQHLGKIFASKKGQTARDFLKNADFKTINTRIRPYIEKKIIKIFSILKETDIKLYEKLNNTKTLYPEDEIKINIEPATTVFNIIKHSEGTRYFLSVKQQNREISLTGKHVSILSEAPCMFVMNAELFYFEDIDAKKLRPFFDKEFINIPKSAEQVWFRTFAAKAVKKYDVNAQGFDIKQKKTDKKAHILLENNWQNKFNFLLSFKYDTKTYLPNNASDGSTEFNEADFSFRKIVRDKQWEQEIIDYLTAQDLIFDKIAFYVPGKFVSPEFQHQATIYWLNKHPKVFEREDVIFEQRFSDKSYFTDSVSIDFTVKAERDWFDLQAKVKFGKFELPFIRLKYNILNKIPELELPDGSIALIPETWFSKYEAFFILGETKKSNIRLKKYHYKLLQKAETDNSELAKLQQLEFPKNYKTDIPDDIRADLRPYQKEGFYWMTILHEHNTGGCLADDMGLGKTLQTITLLQKVINDRKAKIVSKPNAKSAEQLDLFAPPVSQIYERKASLIVMPVSLIHNWELEIMKFSPFLKVLKYRGVNRKSKFDDFSNYDIILTGYGTVRNDIDLLKKYEFLYVILDESQFIKNPDSKIYKAVMQLESENRLVLTGTPVENSLTDLWAQMNFINPGILGSRRFFKQHYLAHIDKDIDNERAEQLSDIIKPFFLRRTKDEVAKDLPELSEQIIYCSMTPEQQEIYESEKSKIRNFILNPEQKNIKNQKSILIIQALTKLRQLANHPKLTEPDYEGDAGKFQEITRSAESILAENHKVLIFSSFVKHLNLLAEYFDKQHYKYAVLTGQTTDRAGAVQKFQEEEDIKLFLISIKSGGTGLNLTQADYVFILDPWWNPATEAQAVNRAHRIGQDKNVMVYRFITKNTVEEKIRLLQAQKIKLSDKFIQSNNPLKELSDNELTELFD